MSDRCPPASAAAAGEFAGSTAEPALPPVVAAVTATGTPVRLAWINEVGGRTFEVADDAGRYFLKWTPAGSGVDLGREVVRLRWAARFTPVPAVLDQGTDAAGSWIATAALPGENAVADRWLADPAPAVAAIGAGLRALHEALPVSGCPFSWSAEDRIADARLRAGQLDPASWHSEHRGLGVEQALAALRRPPQVDRLVVCHGDSCAPNTLLSAEGAWTGHVDLGSLGVADRWADLAVATWSTEWNYGPGWSQDLLAAYGIEADPVRMRFYRLLWDLGP
ncbi:aminoglycoside 3'-phosphotransferase [Jatrophihabitans sp.]|uniref:aminoglycoside 3'-phosphotransferase n=1 Tax=Jatrophihabitans sp. TaxID=1932789 RepID=UPI002F259CF8